VPAPVNSPVARYFWSDFAGFMPRDFVLLHHAQNIPPISAGSTTKMDFGVFYAAENVKRAKK
jgi:hypothetical protein